MVCEKTTAAPNLQNFSKLFENYEEVPEPVETQVKGEIPAWVDVTLLRNGPGMFKIGECEYRHWFDGMAYLQRFHFAHGKMTYSAKYLQSEAYRINMAANRIVLGEFGTTGFPDPCKSLLGRLATHVQPEKISDNASVNFVVNGDSVWAVTETPVLHKVDPKTLETGARVDVAKYVTLNTFTAHQMYDADGNIFHIGTRFGKKSEYVFAVTKPRRPGTSDSEAFAETSLVGTLAATEGTQPCYFHSFGMTDNYLILFESPLRLNVLKLLVRNAFKYAYADTMSFHENTPTFIRILDKRTGKEVKKAKFTHEAFFTFHHANAYEQEGCLVLDYCSIRNPGDLTMFQVETLKQNGLGSADALTAAFGSRMVIPVEEDLDKHTVGDELLRGKTCAEGCKAILRPHGEVRLQARQLTDLAFEFPRFNMQANLKPYRFLYGGVLQRNQANLVGLLKLDLVTGERREWHRDHKKQIAGEPVFVARPGASAEDDGVILAPVMNYAEEDPFVVVIDAHSFTEVARCMIPRRLPLCFHAVSIPN